jgi:UDP-glucuronate decarboxylase
VDDTVSALLALMASPPEVTGPINIGNPTEITIRELAERVRSLGHLRRSVSPRRRRITRPDISLARRSLGSMPLSLS